MDNKAILVLILNLIIPGVGTLVAGDKKSGIWQLVIYVIGLATSWLFIGLPVMLAAWIWALISSLKYMGVM